MRRDRDIRQEFSPTSLCARKSKIRKPFQLSQINAHEFKIHINLIIQHYSLRFQGKRTFLISGTEHTCVRAENREPSEVINPDQLLTLYLPLLRYQLTMINIIYSTSSKSRFCYVHMPSK